MNNRIPAVPLFVHDPYFSIWSPADHLYDEDTQSWTGKKMPVRGIVTVDGTEYSVLGRNGTLPVLPQTNLDVQPTQSIITFGNAQVVLQLTFSQHFDLADLQSISEPVTYLTACAQAKDGQPHAVSLRLRFDSHIVYEDLHDNRLVHARFDLDGTTAVSIGKARQAPLSHCGDLIDIDWGHLYLAATTTAQVALDAYTEWNEQGLEAVLDLSTNQPQPAALLVAYDDLQSINYFGQFQLAYWKKAFPSILTLLETRAQQVGQIVADCGRINQLVNKQAQEVGGEDYRLICATAYRQSIGAHKLIRDENGELVFLSKECNSNACIGTVDVSYPSIPLYLAYNPELVQAMVRPVVRFAQLPVWPFAFAPHDVGRYPYATGQVYGMNESPVDDGTRLIDNDTVSQFYLYPANADLYREESQMPIEESADLILMSCTAEGLLHNGFVAANREQLLAWSQFLIANGQDPENQLCTDDFAGHLAHNVNLSLKAIVALAALGKTLSAIGDDATGAELTDKAHAMAAIWLETAATATDTKLAFDQEAGWSLKYNLIWDEVLHLDLFPATLKANELNRYLKQANAYGTPLDPRATYTKVDWEMWVAALSDDRAQFDQFTKPVVKFLNETKQRQPFSDWHETVSGDMVAFKNRSVIGGVFMPLLKSLKRFEG